MTTTSHDHVDHLPSFPTLLTAPRPPMLVCATDPGVDEPYVSVADGVYETSTERVFWRGTPDSTVLRLPIDLPVATRPIRQVPTQRGGQVAVGELSLLKAVRVVRAEREAQRSSSLTRSAPAGGLGEVLQQAVRDGDTDVACARAVLLWRQAGLERVYQELSRCLAGLASGWAAGSGTVLAQHQAARVVASVTDHLARLTPSGGRGGTIVLAVPEGEQHTLCLRGLENLLNESGRPTQVVDDLPRAELLALAALPGTAAVLVSAHTPITRTCLRTLLRDLRDVGPNLLLAVGGPGLPDGQSSTFGADLRGTDLHALLARLSWLDQRESGLTDRERQVLNGIADGLTNGQIAQQLGVAPATVKSHLDRIFAKTKTEHRAAAVARALRCGWIS